MVNWNSISFSHCVLYETVNIIIVGRPFSQQNEECRKCDLICSNSAAVASPTCHPSVMGNAIVNMTASSLVLVPGACGDPSRSSHPIAHMVLAGQSSAASALAGPSGLRGESGDLALLLSRSQLLLSVSPGLWPAPQSISYNLLQELAFCKSPRLEGRQLLLSSPAEIPQAKPPKATATCQNTVEGKVQSKRKQNHISTSLFFFHKSILPSVDSVISYPEMTSLVISVLQELAD